MLLTGLSSPQPARWKGGGQRGKCGGGGGVRQGQETSAAPPLAVWKLSENIKPPGPRPRRSHIYGTHKAFPQRLIYATVIKSAVVLLFLIS